MWPGPVFQVELTTSARRRGYYLVRALYGLVLLTIVGQNYFGWRGRAGDHFSADDMSRFAYITYSSIAAFQAFAVLGLTPALVAGTIASEKQRKTLHYLMSSRLSGGEIVLGKLMARLLHVGVFLAIGLPVTSLLVLLGGVDPRLILVVYLGTGATVFFLAALSILVSIFARRVRDAITAVYSLEAAWLVLPFIARVTMPLSWPKIYAWVQPWNDWLLASSPMVLINGGLFRGGTRALVGDLAWMIGLQFGAGAVFAAVAVVLVRWVFRRQESAGNVRLKAIAHWRLNFLPRPPVGQDPMLWKEKYTSRTTGAAKIGGLVVGIGFLIALGYATFDFAWPAFRELRHSSYGFPGPDRDQFLGYLRLTVAALGMLMVLGVAVASSTGITTEREEDTWVSLIATPVEGREILRAKLVGPVWSMRWIAPIVAALVLLGVASGSVHPMSILLYIFVLAAEVWFATAVGTYFSLRSSSTWRAQSLTIGALLLLNGGYLVMACPLLFGGWPLLGLGLAPMVQACSLLNFNDYRDYVRGLGLMTSRGMDWDDRMMRAILAYGLHLVLYAGVATVLAWAAYRRFDDAVGRPRRGPAAAEDATYDDAVGAGGCLGPKEKALAN